MGVNRLYWISRIWAVQPSLDFMRVHFYHLWTDKVTASALTVENTSMYNYLTSLVDWIKVCFKKHPFKRILSFLWYKNFPNSICTNPIILVNGELDPFKDDISIYPFHTMVCEVEDPLVPSIEFRKVTKDCYAEIQAILKQYESALDVKLPF